MKKKFLIPICIMVALIIGLIIFLIIFLNKGKIPKEYRGEWVHYMCFYVPSTEKDSSSDFIDTTYTLTISKNDLTYEGDDYAKYSFEIEDGNAILKFTNKETNETSKQYLLVDKDKLYISNDKKKDDKDTIFVRKGSKADIAAKGEYICDYYQECISKLGTDSLKIINPETDSYIYFLEKEDLTDEEQAKKDDDLNYYYGFYKTHNSELELNIDKNTNKLSFVKYTITASKYNVEKDSAILNSISDGIVQTILNDKKNNKKITELSKDDLFLLELESTLILKKLYEETDAIKEYEDENIRISVFQSSYSDSVTLYISAK